MATPAIDIIYADGRYTASIESMGISTQGKTWDELMMMIQDAIQCYYQWSIEIETTIKIPGFNFRINPSHATIA